MQLRSQLTMCCDWYSTLQEKGENLKRGLTFIIVLSCNETQNCQWYQFHSLDSSTSPVHMTLISLREDAFSWPSNFPSFSLVFLLLPFFLSVLFILWVEWLLRWLLWGDEASKVHTHKDDSVNVLQFSYNMIPVPSKWNLSLYTHPCTINNADTDTTYLGQGEGHFSAAQNRALAHTPQLRDTFWLQPLTQRCPAQWARTGLHAHTVL